MNAKLTTNCATCDNIANQQRRYLRGKLFGIKIGIPKDVGNLLKHFQDWTGLLEKKGRRQEKRNETLVWLGVKFLASMDDVLWSSTAIRSRVAYIPGAEKREF